MENIDRTYVIKRNKSEHIKEKRKVERIIFSGYNGI
jgi:hypothetical protein